jgi:predicted amidohydrolase
VKLALAQHAIEGARVDANVERAAENLLYVGTVNGSDTFDDAELRGRSTVYDPWGTVLASSDDEPTTVTADLTPDRVRAVREEFPAWQDRRL